MVLFEKSVIFVGWCKCAPMCSGVLLKMEVGICNGAWQRARRYPAYLWSLRWVYADKKTRRLIYAVYPRIPPNTPLPMWYRYMVPWDHKKVCLMVGLARTAVCPTHRQTDKQTTETTDLWQEASTRSMRHRLKTTLHHHTVSNSLPTQLTLEICSMTCSPTPKLWPCRKICLLHLSITKPHTILVPTKLCAFL